jgi:hypothetical protein
LIRFSPMVVSDPGAAISETAIHWRSQECFFKVSIGATPPPARLSENVGRPLQRGWFAIPSSTTG